MSRSYTTVDDIATDTPPQTYGERRTILRKAAIQARRDVKIARAQSDGYLFYRGIAVFLTVLAAVIITITIVTHDGPQQAMLVENHQFQMQRLCLQKSWDWDSSTDVCSRP